MIADSTALLENATVGLQLQPAKTAELDCFRKQCLNVVRVVKINQSLRQFK